MRSGSRGCVEGGKVERAGVRSRVRNGSSGFRGDVEEGANYSPYLL